MNKYQKIADEIFVNNNYRAGRCCENCKHFSYSGQFYEGYWHCDILPCQANEVQPSNICNKFKVEDKNG